MTPKHETTPLHDTDLTKLCGGHLSHDEVAGRVRMLMRHDLDHEPVCTMARDRIKWLAWRVEQLELTNAQLMEAAGDLAVATRNVIAISDRKHDAWDNAKSAATMVEQLVGESHAN